ncbi:MAG TPA: DUF4861 family protein, partial [Flavisolibacter sp.]|nr:DUF4861 family protein [Flavisolibacter sp.]
MQNKKTEIDSSRFSGKTFSINMKSLILFFILFSCLQTFAQSSIKNGWYTEGNFIPEHRIKITVTNVLKIPLKDQPIVVERTSLPFQNIAERWVAVVDPALPENPKPSAEDLKKMGGYVKNQETNGHAVELQLDDMDKDGVWDELFFLTDMGAGETRDFYIYFDP